jgi:hypothetical protein
MPKEQLTKEEENLVRIGTDGRIDVIPKWVKDLWDWIISFK